VLVERQLLVNSDAKISGTSGMTAFETRIAARSSTLSRPRVAVSCITSDFVGLSVECVDLQPRVNNGCAFHELTDVVGHLLDTDFWTR